MSADRTNAIEKMLGELATGDRPEAGAVAKWHQALLQTQQWAQTESLGEALEAAGAAASLAHSLLTEMSEPDFKLTRELFTDELTSLLALLRTDREPGTSPASEHATPSEPESSSDLGMGPTPPEPDDNGQDEASPFGDDVELVSDFAVEGLEQLAESDSQLLAIEKDPQDADALAAVFRCFHTLKGLAGFMQLGDVERLAHATEDLLDQARMGHRELAGPAIDLVFEACDLMKRLVQEIDLATQTGRWKQTQRDAVDSLTSRLRDLAHGPRVSASPAMLAPPDPAASSAPRPAKPAGADAPAPSNNPELTDPTPSGSTDDAPEVAAAAADPASMPDASPLASASVSPAAATTPSTSPPEPANVAPPSMTAPEIMVPEEASASEAGSSGPRRAQHDSIRVDADRLGGLIEMIGELVITESLVKRDAELVAHDRSRARELLRNLQRLDKITRDLQELAGSLRMVPVRAAFRKMARLARDVARKSDKHVDFVMSGEETELDKTVVDRIGDPLVHMVRNAIDHGLELDPDDRVRAGKPSIGRVELRAFHRGGKIHIEVQDDGRGLNPAIILKKAQERGLVPEGSESLSDREVLQLICVPGFSTAAKITSISGRGVGMDVVKKGIDAMGGTLEISSELGSGTCFSMQLPLTLAVIDGMVIRMGMERYIIPTLSVVRLVTPAPGDITSVLAKGEMLSVQNELIPILELDRMFGVQRERPDAPLAIVAEAEGTRVSFMIDELVGQQQAVIKSLSAGLGDTPGLSGCAIMTDGRVGLVLDVSGLVRIGRDGVNPSRQAANAGPTGATA